MRRSCLDLIPILTLAGAVRLAMFSGFVLGDDPAYGTMVRGLLTQGYPIAEGTNVFASRPLLLGFAAASIKLLGWTEAAFVLPVLLASLTGVACAYFLATQLVDRTAGLLSAAALSLFPLDVVYSTTMAN